MTPHPPISTLFPYTTLFRSTYYRLAAPGSDGWFEIIGVVGDTPNVGLHEPPAPSIYVPYTRSEEHTSELQSHHDPVCRLLLEKINCRLESAARRGLP